MWIVRIKNHTSLDGIAERRRKEARKRRGNPRGPGHEPRRSRRRVIKAEIGPRRSLAGDRDQVWPFGGGRGREAGISTSPATHASYSAPSRVPGHGRIPYSGKSSAHCGVSPGPARRRGGTLRRLVFGCTATAPAACRRSGERAQDRAQAGPASAPRRRDWPARA